MAQVEIRQGSTVICTGTSSCSGPIPVPESARAGDSLTVTAIATDTAGNATTTTRAVRVTADGVVTGTVLDDLTSLPLAGASVTLLGANSRTTTTDANGRYNIPVSDISALLRFEKAAFSTVDRVVSVASGVGTVPADARLTELAAVTNAPGTSPAVVGPVSVALPDGDHQITRLSAQGLPNLLPLGFSPLVALSWTSAAPPIGPAQATMTLPVSAPESLLVRYDPGMRDWRIVATALVETGGFLTVDLAATGSMRLDSPTSLPSGTVVQADVEETYTLASGEEASAPSHSCAGSQRACLCHAFIPSTTPGYSAQRARGAPGLSHRCPQPRGMLSPRRGCAKADIAHGLNFCSAHSLWTFSLAPVAKGG